MKLRFLKATFLTISLWFFQAFATSAQDDRITLLTERFGNDISLSLARYTATAFEFSIHLLEKKVKNGKADTGMVETLKEKLKIYSEFLNSAEKDCIENDTTLLSDENKSKFLLHVVDFTSTLDE